MVNLPTPRGDRPGSLMVNNGSQRSGFESRWRHFEFLIRFFFFFPRLFVFHAYPSHRLLSGMLPAIKVTVNQIYRQSSLPAIKFTCNQSIFFKRSSQYPSRMYVFYASEGVTPPNFNQELLEKMMARKNPTNGSDSKNQSPFSPPDNHIANSTV